MHFKRKQLLYINSVKKGASLQEKKCNFQMIINLSQQNSSKWINIWTAEKFFYKYARKLSILSLSCWKQTLLAVVQWWHGEIEICITEKENRKCELLLFDTDNNTDHTSVMQCKVYQYMSCHKK